MATDGGPGALEGRRNVVDRSIELLLFPWIPLLEI